MSDQSYRPCVLIVLLNQDGQVLVGERTDINEPTWQLPQGGIEIGESTRKAAKREMREEIGTDNATLLKISKKWMTYDLPKASRQSWMGNKWIGQKVRATAFLFNGPDADININTENPEFRAWRWEELEALPDLIVFFKRNLYRSVVSEFIQTRNQLRTA